MAYATHELRCLVYSDVSQRNSRISIVEERVYDLALFEPCYGTVLPVDRTDIRCDTLERSMTAHKCIVAKLKSLVQQTPKLVVVTLCKYCYLWKVQADNTLVETSFPFVLTVLVLPR